MSVVFGICFVCVRVCVGWGGGAGCLCVSVWSGGVKIFVSQFSLLTFQKSKKTFFRV